MRTQALSLAAAFLVACSSSAPESQASSASAPAAQANTTLNSSATSNPTPTPASAPAERKDTDMTTAQAPAGFHAFPINTLDGKPADLSAYKGKVVLVVNTASECGLTPQYKGLEKLHQEFAARGFSVLGFPCNDFGGQEPGSPTEIQQFCTSKYSVTFPLFEKVRTKNGAGQSPIYAWFSERTGELPGWNFGKYLVGKDGTSVKFFGSRTAPDDSDLRKAIEAELAK
ncbi:MAG: glutathione peroxidase [Planctomycetota bacterium]